MLEECFCRGYNENCAWCHGSGRKKVQLARPVFASVPRTRANKGAAQVRCGFCGEWAGDLAGHTQQKHPGHRPATWTERRPAGKPPRTAPAKPAQSAKPAKPAKTVKAAATLKGKDRQSVLITKRVAKARRLACPVCPEVVDGLPAHMIASHGWRTEAGLVVEPGPGKRLKALCPECDVPVRRARLDEHRARVHAVRVSLAPSAHPTAANSPPEKRKAAAGTSRAKSAGEKRRSKGRKAAQVQPRTYIWDADRWGSFEQERVERLSDATRGLGYARRESGHWGSTVAFDDYGDESSA